MSCGPNYWRKRRVERFGTGCCDDDGKMTVLLPYSPDPYLAGTVVVIDDAATAAGTRVPMAKVIDAPPAADGCKPHFVITCEEDPTHNNPDMLPCKVQVCGRGLFSVADIPWPDAWGVDEIRQVINAAWCCGLRFFWPDC